MSRRHLWLRPLEGRLAPANNLTLTDGPSANLSVLTSGTETLIRTLGPGAVLNVADLEQALANPQVQQVTVSSAVGPGGTDAQEPGSIAYDGATASDLDLSAVGVGKTLLFQTAAGTNATGGITLNGVSIGGAPAGPAGTWVKFDTSATNGDVVFGSGGVSFDGPAVGDLNVSTGTGAFTYADGGGAPDAARVGGWIMVQAGGQITLANRDGLHAVPLLFIQGQSVALGTSLSSVSNTVVEGATTLTADVSLTATAANGDVSFGQPVDGHFGLTLSGATCELFGELGGTTPLASLAVRHGFTSFGPNPVLAGFVDQVVLGDASPGVPATLAGVAEIAANIVVNPGGRLDPGLPGTPGTMQVNGNVTFAGGDLVLDLGPTCDLLHVLGNVTIAGGNLGGGAGSGHLTGPGDVQVLRYTGTLTGQFDNAPVGAAVQVGGDAVRVTNYGPAATGMTIAQIPAVAGGTYVGADADGTGLTAKLTGGGELVTAIDAGGGRFFVVRNSTPVSKLAITTRANASDDVAALSGLVVDGPLAGFTGPKVDVANQFRVLGSASTVVLRDLVAPGPTGLELGGNDTDISSVTARDLTGPVRVPGVLSALKARNVAGDVTAAAAGKIQVGNAAGSVTVAGPVTSFTAAGAFDGALTAGDLGTFQAGAVAGASTVALTGGQFPLRSVIVAGDFDGTLTVPGGTIQSVAVGGAFAGSVSTNHLIKFRAGSLDGDLTMLDIPGFRAGVIDSVTVTGAAVGSMTAKAIGQVKAGGGALTIRVPNGNLGTVQFVGDATADIDAGFVQSVTAGGTLTGLGPWDVPFGMRSLTAGALAGLDLTTAFVGILTVKGSRATGRAGDVTGCAFHISGVNAVLGLTTVLATGTVRGTTFDVTGGGVGTMTVGRFIDSNLYVDYTPAGAFNTGGAFGSGGGTIQRFTTTAPPSADPTGPSDWAFAGSQIAAPQLGTIRLSGVRTANGGTAFGIKCHTGLGGVQAKAADDPALPLNTGLLAQPAAQAGDFFYLVV
jgi:hypothetical protein